MKQFLLAAAAVIALLTCQAAQAAPLADEEAAQFISQEIGATTEYAFCPDYEMVPNVAETIGDRMGVGENIRAVPTVQSHLPDPRGGPTGEHGHERARTKTASECSLGKVNGVRVDFFATESLGHDLYDRAGRAQAERKIGYRGSVRRRARCRLDRRVTRCDERRLGAR
jgi:hypothetical protein